eukprot:EC788849.1.p3 GENE.EC788849.1~~EC788849.1.p3  ORF type:complete len:56 (+),score=22.72 EC788849.1:2-169(+)
MDDIGMNSEYQAGDMAGSYAAEGGQPFQVPSGVGQQYAEGFVSGYESANEFQNST